MSIIKKSEELVSKDEKLLFKTTRHPLSLVWPTILLLFSFVVLANTVNISVFVGKQIFSGYTEEYCAKYGVVENDPFRADLWKTTPGHKVAVGIILCLCGLMIGTFACELADYYTREFAVTDKRIFTKWGLLGIHVSKTYINKIESLKDGQGPIQRLVGCGDVTTVGTGGDTDSYSCLVDYKGFLEAAEGAIAATPKS